MTHWVMVLAFSGMVFAQAGNPIVSPPQSPPVTVRNEIVVEAPKPDPQAIADASMQSYQSIVVNLIAPTLVQWTNDLLSVPDFIRSTPPDLSYRNSAVRGLADQVRLVALGLVVLAVIVMGISIMLGGQVPDNMGRLLFGVALSATDLLWWELGIDLNNAINAGITAPSIADVIRPHLSLPAVTSDPVAAFAPALLVIVYAIIALLLLISLAFRLGLIDILIAVGPLALLCAATEQTNSLYSRYVGLAVGTLVSQVLVVVALRLSPVLGTLVSGVAGTILGIVVLLLARQMPQMMASAGVRQGNTMSTAIALLVRRAILRR